MQDSSLARSEGFSRAQCCLQTGKKAKNHTYEILAQTLHLHVYVLGGITRQSLQTRSWHSAQRSPRSKIRPKVLRQRAHCRCPTSWGRCEPFCLISSSSFFSLLFDRESRTSGDDEKSASEVAAAFAKSSPYPLLLLLPQFLVFLQHLQDRLPFVFQQKGEVQLLRVKLHWSLSLHSTGEFSQAWREVRSSYIMLQTAPLCVTLR